ncbi:MAG TPA: YCF48-related protein [Bacteroidia bacterium]|nr:YCF48-related protein [Bacteroidia bacterium]
MKKILLCLITAIVALSSSLTAQQWAPLISGTSESLLDVYTFDCDTAYVCGSSGTVLKTINGGTTWTALTSGVSEDLYSIFFTSATTGYAVGNNGTAITTTNGGASWSAISLGSYTFREVYFVSATEGYVLGGTSSTTGVIYRYSSGTWSPATVSSGNTFYTFAKISGSNYLTTNYDGEVFQSTNGGTTWNLLSNPTASPLLGLALNSSGDACAVSSGGLIIKSTNGGSSWSSVTSGTSDYLTDIDFLTSSSKGFAVGGDIANNTGRIIYTTNGGTNWSNCTLPSGTKRIYAAGFNSYCGYAVGLNGTILKYIDCSNSYVWSKLTSGTSNSILGVSAVDENTVYVCGASGLILKSTNGGSTWTSQTSGTIQTLYSISFVDANTGYAVGDGGANIKTTDGGAHWSSMSLSTSDALREVRFNGSTGYISGGVSASSGRVYVSTNSGSTWTTLSPGASNIVYSTFFTSSTNGFASSSNGNVYKTTNSGSSWTAVSTGAAATASKIYFTSSTDGILVNNSGQIRMTTNSGSSWSSVTSPTSNPLTGLDLLEGSTLYAVGGNVTNDTPTMVKGSGSSWSSVTTLPSGIHRLYGIDFVGYVGYSVGLSGTIIKTFVCKDYARPSDNTGITESSNAYKTFFAYPNPTSGSTSIDLSKQLFEQEANFELYDMAGKRVLNETTINKNIFTFETKQLSPGVYFFKIYDAQTIIGNGKLVVQ